MLSSLKNFFLSFLVSLVIFGVIACAVLGALGAFRQTNAGPGFVTQNYEEYQDKSNEESRLTELDGHSFNLLLVGLDYAPALFYDTYDPDTVANLPLYQTSLSAGSAAGEDGYRVISADALMLLCISKERREFAFSSLHPGTLVTVDGASICLGDVYETYGLDQLIESIHTLTGLPIDRYAVVGMDDFPALIDTVDGVDFNVPCDMVYNDNRGQLHIDIEAGYQHLDGKTAAEVIRFNSYEGVEFSRLKTAIGLARALLTKMTEPKYMTKAVAMFKQIDRMLVTNFTVTDLTDNLDLLFSYPDFEAVTVDPVGHYSTIDGRLCFLPTANACVNAFAPYRRAAS